MIALTLFLPVPKIAAGLVAARVAWWLLGDLVLDTVDLPFREGFSTGTGEATDPDGSLG